MWIENDGIRLNARLDMPEHAGTRVPLVIIIHGFTGHMEERHIVAVQKAVNEAGYAALRVDMYGHGHSDGKFEDHTLYKWLTNVMAVMDYATGLSFVSRIYLCGHSQGGMTAMLAGAMLHDRIAGLLPLSPAWMIPEYARKGELLGIQFDPEHVPDMLTAWDGKKLKGNYVRVAQTIRVEDAIDRYHGPVPLIHGDKDEAVPYEYAQRASLPYTDATLVRIPDDTHCYDLHLDMVTDAVRAWLLKQKG